MKKRICSICGVSFVDRPNRDISPVTKCESDAFRDLWINTAKRSRRKNEYYCNHALDSCCRDRCWSRLLYFPVCTAEDSDAGAAQTFFQEGKIFEMNEFGCTVDEFADNVANFNKSYWWRMSTDDSPPSKGQAKSNMEYIIHGIIKAYLERNIPVCKELMSFYRRYDEGKIDSEEETTYNDVIKVACNFTIPSEDKRKIIECIPVNGDSQFYKSLVSVIHASMSPTDKSQTITTLCQKMEEAME